MKKHIVSLWYQVPGVGHVYITALIPDHKNEEGRAICFPEQIYKAKYGIGLPLGTRIALL